MTWGVSSWRVPTERVAVVLPGRGYTPARPLLHFTRSVLEFHGWTVRELWWRPPVLSEYLPWVREQTELALDTLPVGQLLVGKSLGSLAAPVAVRRGLPAVWLTPLMSNSTVVEALEKSTAPTLLVGGTADVLWDPETARRTGHQVWEVPDADHGMQTPDPVRSAEIVRRYTSRLSEFVASL